MKHSKKIAPKRKAHASKASKKSTYALYGASQLKACLDSLRQIYQTPIATFVTLMVIAVTILLPTTFLFTIKSMQNGMEHTSLTNQITVFIKPATPEPIIKEWARFLQNQPAVMVLTLISAQDALKEMTQQTGYTPVITSLGENPLPSVLLIKPAFTAEESLQKLIAQLKAKTFVDAVHYDPIWVNRVSALLQLGERMILALTILFSVGVLFIISHTIQGATQRNHEEMQVLHFLGATKAYIRRPFLYMGALLGLGGGIIAVILLMGLFYFLKQPIFQFLSSYNIYSLHLLDTRSLLAILLLSACLGWLGAIIAFQRSKIINKSALL